MVVSEIWGIQVHNNTSTILVRQKLYYRTFRAASPLLLPTSLQVIAETQPIHCFRDKKEVRKNSHFKVNKAQVSTPGRDGLLNELANCHSPKKESNSK